MQNGGRVCPQDIGYIIVVGVLYIAANNHSFVVKYIDFPYLRRKAYFIPPFDNPLNVRSPLGANSPDLNRQELSLLVKGFNQVVLKIFPFGL